MSETLEKEVQLHERDAQGQDWLVYPLPPGGYPLTVDKGGTGAESAASAREALGITPENIGAAASGHSHALSDLSGMLPVTKGGTGATDAANARSNLGVTLANLGAAALDHPHALTDANITGVLPISKGGTGASTAAATRNALGLGNTTGAVPIANGGTGETTVAAARNALGLGNTTSAVPIANGGTGQTTAAAARNALGLGNTTSALPVANGGTGATTAAAALTALGAASASSALVVSASGNSGTHYYLRFTNGLQICYGTYSWSTAMANSFGSIYLSDTHGSFSFPVAFASVMAAVGTKRGAIANTGLYRMASSATGLSGIAMFRGNSNSTAATQEIDYFVIGTWS